MTPPRELSWYYCAKYSRDVPVVGLYGAHKVSRHTRAKSIDYLEIQKVDGRFTEAMRRVNVNGDVITFFLLSRSGQIG